MSKIIYLASYKANHPDHDMVYQDINGLRDIDGDMMDVDLDPYDIIIATPPCNYYSRANWRRETSVYSQATKHLLPSILEKLCNQSKPFIVENVRNSILMNKHDLFNFPCHIYTFGRHTYWTNMAFNPHGIKQQNDYFAANKSIPGKKGFYKTPDGKITKSAGQNIQLLDKKDRQGGENVHNVIEYWLKVVEEWQQSRQTPSSS